MEKSKQRKISVLLIFLGVLLVIIELTIVWFHIPYSPVKRQFQNDIVSLIAENVPENEVFSEKDFSHLPTAIQKYIVNCGYIGTHKMSYLKMVYHDVDFSQGKNGPNLKIDYTQYNFVKNPCRLALIDTNMFGIPFEGYDYYQNGVGGMKGVLAKSVTLFHQKGTDMDRACLVTFLAESLFVPNVLLQNYIFFREISEFETWASVSYLGQTVSGIFTFNQQYEMVSFTTNDRAAASSDGSLEYIPWSAVCSDYQISENGIKYPEKFQAVWHYPDGDFVYFHGNISQVSYG